MRIGIATDNPFPPELLGGLQFSSLTLASSLREKGQDVFILCGLQGNGFKLFFKRLIKKLFKRVFIKDFYNGIPLFRTWFPKEEISRFVDLTHIDVLIIASGNQASLAAQAEKIGLPVLLWCVDIFFDNQGGDLKKLKTRHVVTNSQFTGRKCLSYLGIEPTVVLPMIDPSKYKTTPSRDCITFINPHPIKGIDLALKIAQACPDIPFSLYMSWSLEDAFLNPLNAALKNLGNVSLYQTASDPRNIYKKTKILLTPSKAEEAYGRVATEAQFSGIPVVASTRGGLPEAVGDGGILLDYDAPIADWVKAVRSLWDDETLYQELSAKAVTHANRKELDLDYQTACWIEALERTLEDAR